MNKKPRREAKAESIPAGKEEMVDKIMDQVNGSSPAEKTDHLKEGDMIVMVGVVRAKKEREVPKAEGGSIKVYIKDENDKPFGVMVAMAGPGDKIVHLGWSKIAVDCCGEKMDIFDKKLGTIIAEGRAKAMKRHMAVVNGVHAIPIRGTVYDQIGDELDAFRDRCCSYFEGKMVPMFLVDDSK